MALKSYVGMNPRLQGPGILYGYYK